MTNLIKELEYNDDLKGFEVTLNDDRTVYVQFDKETNRLSADYNCWFPEIYEEYSAEITEEEEKEILKHPEIIAFSNELDEKGGFENLEK